MYYAAEDILPAVQAAEKLFGISGNMDQDAGLKNYTLATRKFGKIWYGDIAGSRKEVNAKCIQLAEIIGEQVWLNAQDEHGLN